MSDTDSTRTELVDPQTYSIFGAAIEVHRKMGRGFLEQVYFQCLEIEFQRRSIPYEREVSLPVRYDGILLPVSFRVDFVCYESIVVEVKALSAITGREEAQVLNYLRASGMRRGVLLNFGTDLLGKHRYVWRLPFEQDPMRLK
jgi:GxxExxY protein